MKTNEAPEKIYVEIKHPFSEEYTQMIAFEDGDGIEYTCTDAFIDKACEWINNNADKYVSMHVGYDESETYHYVTDDLVKDFKKYAEEQL